ncbi:MAG: hypothetical protein L0177_19815 [Chloroflexi bacterium]|nr:hypothetical protein [Chloroflexota bacterium]
MQQTWPDFNKLSRKVQRIFNERDRERILQLLPGPGQGRGKTRGEIAQALLLPPKKIGAHLRVLKARQMVHVNHGLWRRNSWTLIA